VGKIDYEIDPEFAKVAAAWPNLSAPIRAAVLALVKATLEGTA
jgi:hypothetical protein